MFIVGQASELPSPEARQSVRASGRANAGPQRSWGGGGKVQLQIETVRVPSCIRPTPSFPSMCSAVSKKLGVQAHRKARDRPAGRPCSQLAASFRERAESVRGRRARGALCQGCGYRAFLRSITHHRLLFASKPKNPDED